MKRLFIYLIVLSVLYSCDCTETKFKVHVQYMNGDVDTLILTDNTCKNQGLYLNNGCIYRYYTDSRYEPNFQGCVVCGVRSCYIIKNN